ncbi:MAG: hypothetical protein KBT87_06780 [Gammaproteobacteria bacterium]|nr:hypothetical protein [Gammaproteobacteria bacterium]MBQ0774357.1 hypothetical protein [Gammaproteobacteria bacterium]
MMMRIGLAAMLFCCVLNPAHANELQRVLLKEYHEALSHEDADTLTQLIADDAQIQIILEQDSEESLTLTLTRAEYIQQLRALWRFSESQAYSQSDLRWLTERDGFQVSLQQHERYQLFGETLEQKSRVRLGITTLNHTAYITRIEARTPGW